MVDSISDCIEEANRQVHDCHTITGGKNVQNCEPKKCPEKRRTLQYPTKEE